MELWIRSQDKCGLFKINEVYIDERDYGNNVKAFYIRNNYTLLGRYESEKRALEILDKIQQMMCLDVTFSGQKGYENIDLKMKALYIQQSRLIYNMPEE